MKILSWIAMGLVVGLFAKIILPNKNLDGVIMTIMLGIAGCVVGGFIGHYFELGTVTGFNFVSLSLATGGSIILLIIYSYIW